MQEQAVEQLAVALPIKYTMVGTWKNRITNSLPKIEPVYVHRLISKRHETPCRRNFTLNEGFSLREKLSLNIPLSLCRQL